MVYEYRKVLSKGIPVPFFHLDLTSTLKDSILKMPAWTYLILLLFISRELVVTETELNAIKAAASSGVIRIR